MTTEQQRKRSAKASENQKEILINFLENNLDIANDKFVSVDGSKLRDSKWSDLAESLNSMGGGIKDPQKWRKYWCDLRAHTRAKYNEVRDKGSGINGPKTKSLTDLEERIIQLQTVEAIEGDLVPELGFPESKMDLTNDSTDVILSIDTLSSLSEVVSSCNTLPSASLSDVLSTNPLPSSSGLLSSNKKKPPTKKINSTPLSKFEQIEEKKLKLMEKRNNLLDESHIIQKEISNKLDVIISAIKDKVCSDAKHP